MGAIVVMASGVRDKNVSDEKKDPPERMKSIVFLP
jgi:hypothetical protein